MRSGRERRGGELGLVTAADECERHGRLCLAVDGEGHRSRRCPLVRRLQSTTAVKVTAWPTVDGSSEDASVVVVVCKPGALTVCVGSDPLLALTLYRRCTTPRPCAIRPRASRW